MPTTLVIWCMMKSRCFLLIILIEFVANNSKFFSEGIIV
jgi:hypothetical protein